MVGGGAFGELAVAEAARAAAVAVRAACKKPPTEAIALEKYAKVRADCWGLSVAGGGCDECGRAAHWGTRRRKRYLDNSR